MMDCVQGEIRFAQTIGDWSREDKLQAFVSKFHDLDSFYLKVIPRKICLLSKLSEITVM